MKNVFVYVTSKLVNETFEGKYFADHYYYTIRANLLNTSLQGTYSGTIILTPNN